MHAALAGAFAGDARADDLGQAVVFRGDDAPALFQLGAHLLGGALGAEHADAQLQVLQGAHLLGHFAHVHGIGRRRHQGRDAKVAHEVDLALGVAGGDGDHGGTHLFPTLVQAERAREQAVAGHILEYVVPTHAHHVHTAGHEVRPGVDVVLRVADGHG